MKLIASDFDGTITRNGGILNDDIEAIKRWRKAGNLFGLVSGRVLFGIEYEAERHGIPCDFIVGASGGQAEDINKKMLFSYTCGHNNIEKMAYFILKYNGSSCGIGYDRTHTDLFINSNDIKTIDVEKMQSIPYTYQMNTSFKTDEEAMRFAQKVNEEFAGIFTAHQNGCCVDIPPYGVSKATGISQIAKIYGIDHKDVITVGDNYNDIPMLTSFNGVAVSTAKDKVKQTAQYIAEDFSQIVEQFM